MVTTVGQFRKQQRQVNERSIEGMDGRGHRGPAPLRHVGLRDFRVLVARVYAELLTRS